MSDRKQVADQKTLECKGENAREREKCRQQQQTKETQREWENAKTAGASETEMKNKKKITSLDKTQYSVEEQSHQT